MKFVKRIFSAVDPGYLKRAYGISTVFLAVMAFILIKDFFETTSLESVGGKTLGFVIIVSFLILSFFLYPFAKLTWDELKRAIFGDTLFIFPSVIVLYAWKLGINYVLWLGSILIAPLGILYLAFRTRAPKGAGIQEE